MATKAEIIKAQEKWKQHCETVQAATAVIINETEEQRTRRINRMRSDYAAFVDYYFPIGPSTQRQGRLPPVRRSTSTQPTRY